MKIFELMNLCANSQEDINQNNTCHQNLSDLVLNFIAYQNSGYLWNYDMYPGKHYQPNLKIDNVVKNLIGGLENSCRHVFMDNFYSRFNFSRIWFKRESKQ